MLGSSDRQMHVCRKKVPVEMLASAGCPAPLRLIPAAPGLVRGVISRVPRQPNQYAPTMGCMSTIDVVLT